jgi:hypothetical protein
MQVKIYNSLGEKLLDKTYANKPVQFDLSNYTAGIYLFEVTMGDKVKTLKVTVD